MADTLQSVKLVDLIPPNLRSDPQVQAAAEALEAELRAATEAIIEALHLPRLNELPESVVDLLAAQWHVDFYEPALPIAKKRALVRRSIVWHRRKGTPGVVQEMVSAVLSSGVVSEWFEYGGDPYKFKVETDEIITDETVYDRLLSLVRAVKNVRSWLESATIRRTWTGTNYAGGAFGFSKKFTITPPVFALSGVRQVSAFGGVVYSGKFITVQ
jgi:phage tail P2-like protein